MTVLIPERRYDKHGAPVTRYVKNDSPVRTPSPALCSPTTLAGHPDGLLPLEGSETPATDRMDERLEGGIELAGVLSYADYADVSSEGVTYGLNLGESLLRDILVGRQLDDEDWADHDNRFRKALTDFDPAALESYFSNQYGAELIHDDGSLTLEFFLEYGAGGAGSVSLESMSMRAMKETDLLEARCDYLTGSTLVSGAAQALGYVWQSTSDGGKYVKDESVLHSANHGQREVLEDFMSDLYDRATRAGSYTEAKVQGAAGIYDSAAHKVSSIRSSRRKSVMTVEEQLRREATTHRVESESEPDETLRSVHAHLEELYLDAARQAEDAA